MRVWVDADACPGEIKELLFRAAIRRHVRVTLVANQRMHTPTSPYIDSIVVPTGIDVAYKRIVEQVGPGDLVITSDIPLAANIIERGGKALSPRGDLFTDENIGERLAVRNMLEDMRAGGEITGGPSQFSAKDKQAFANQFDCWVAKRNADFQNSANDRD